MQNIHMPYKDAFTHTDTQTDTCHTTTGVCSNTQSHLCLFQGFYCQFSKSRGPEEKGMFFKTRDELFKKGQNLEFSNKVKINAGTM